MTSIHSWSGNQSWKSQLEEVLCHSITSLLSGCHGQTPLLCSRARGKFCMSACHICLCTHQRQLHSMAHKLLSIAGIPWEPTFSKSQTGSEMMVPVLFLFSDLTETLVGRFEAGRVNTRDRLDPLSSFLISVFLLPTIHSGEKDSDFAVTFPTAHSSVFLQH